MLIPLISPPVPLGNGILPGEPVKRAGPLDAHHALDGFEPAAIAQLPTDSAEVDVGLLQSKVRKVRAEHGQVESRATEREEQVVAGQFLF